MLRLSRLSAGQECQPLTQVRRQNPGKGKQNEAKVLCNDSCLVPPMFTHIRVRTCANDSLQVTTLLEWLHHFHTTETARHTLRHAPTCNTPVPPLTACTWNRPESAFRHGLLYPRMRQSQSTHNACNAVFVSNKDADCCPAGLLQQGRKGAGQDPFILGVGVGREPGQLASPPSSPSLAQFPTSSPFYFFLFVFFCSRKTRHQEQVKVKAQGTKSYLTGADSASPPPPRYAGVLEGTGPARDARTHIHSRAHRW